MAPAAKFNRLAVMLLVAVTSTSNAHDGTSDKRFSGYGSGTLTREPATLNDSNFSIRASLLSKESPSTAPIVQENGQFSVMANLVATNQVCYNDTIFRDDFDGDGG